MNRYIKRANRGLILAGVLVLGTSAYVGVDYLRFKNGQEEMKSVLTNYMNDFAKAASLPKEKADLDYSLTEADKKAYYEDMIKVLDTYWTKPQDLFDENEYFTRSDLISSYDYVVNDSLKNYPGRIYDYTINANAITFKKHGPGAASFTMEISLSAKTTGTCELLGIPYNEYINYDDYNERFFPEETNEEENFYKGDLLVTATYDITGELYYVDGSWKINYVDYHYLNNPFTIVPLKGGN